MLFWFVCGLVWASPMPIVILGAPAVVPPSSVGQAERGFWVLGLSDCLEERAAGEWNVIDRSAPSKSVAGLRARLGSEGPVGGGVLVLGASDVGGEYGLTQRIALQTFVAELEAAQFRVYLVSLVDTTGSKGSGAREWNEALMGWSKARPGVYWIQLPRSSELFFSKTSVLSDIGAAELAAIVCESVLKKVDDRAPTGAPTKE